ncbi:MAG: c-type cytochrome [Terriglobia bacterium]
MVRTQGEPLLPASTLGMKSSLRTLQMVLFALIVVLTLVSAAGAQSASAKEQGRAVRTQGMAQRSSAPIVELYPAALVESGQSLFTQHCAFCHGRDAEGGESGPDLTRSKLVAADVNGSNIGPVVRNGRPNKGMPAFDLSQTQIDALVAFIHTQKIKAAKQEGGRRGVDTADLQTGDAEAGKRYFNGAGKCSSCHSPTGDLAGVASRYQGLQLEEHMLYPRGARSTVSVTLPSGEVISGTLAYLDEFTVGLRDAAGYYRSWPVSRVKYVVHSPVDAHVDLLGKYTDADIHNLMAYLQTLR